MRFGLLLDANGLRVRFDGKGQRLRLIEVLDLQKCRLQQHGGHKIRESNRAPYIPGSSQPLIRPNISWGIFKRSGHKEWKEDLDIAVILNPQAAWPYMQVRRGQKLERSYYASSLESKLRSIKGTSAKLFSANDKIEFVKIHDENKIELTSRHNPPFGITLRSTPQDLIAELCPPNAI
ncbi:hypothetical protein RUND412_001246 [Rhizina undulata]